MNRDWEKPESLNNQDLDWLAFCYIANELDESARAEFQVRLENDELAQQAVVDAVQQSQLIYSSLLPLETHEPVNLASSAADRPRKSYRRSGILFTSAAALAMVVAGWGWYASQDRSGAIANNDSDQLANAWVETLVAMNENDLEINLDEETQPIEVAYDLSDDWMLVALTDLEGSDEGAE